MHPPLVLHPSHKCYNSRPPNTHISSTSLRPPSLRPSLPGRGSALSLAPPLTPARGLSAGDGIARVCDMPRMDPCRQQISGRLPWTAKRSCPGCRVTARALSALSACSPPPPARARAQWRRRCLPWARARARSAPARPARAARARRCAARAQAPPSEADAARMRQPAAQMLSPEGIPAAAAQMQAEMGAARAAASGAEVRDCPRAHPAPSAPRRWPPRRAITRFGAAAPPPDRSHARAYAQTSPRLFRAAGAPSVTQPAPSARASARGKLRLFIDSASEADWRQLLPSGAFGG